MAEQLPNILIIVLDAARAENFSVLGYPKPTTPNLERYASRMAQYHQCYSTAIWTLPSTTSLFTGSYPSRHRHVIDGDKLAPAMTTLAEMLKAKGYFTAKVTDEIPYLLEFSGLDRGFSYNHIPLPSRWERLLQGRKKQEKSKEEAALPDVLVPEEELSLESISQDLESWKRRLKYWLTGFYDVGAKALFRHTEELWRKHQGVPKFIYLHVNETHAEYRPPHRYRKRFLSPSLRKRNFARINQRPNPHAVGLVEMNEEEYEILTGLYDGCIAYLDERLGLFLDHLSELPDFNDTLIVITSDHGDCIGRHGVLSHQYVCYDEVIHVPFLVKWPAEVGITGHKDQLIQNADLLPTVCSLLSMDRPPHCEGVNILEENREWAYSELLKPFGICAVKRKMHEMAPHYNRAVLALRSLTHKIITYSNDQPDELYHVAVDPRESNNLLAPGKPAPQGEEIQSLQKAMQEWRPRWQEAIKEIRGRIERGDQAAIAPEVEDRLRALGYLD